MEYKGNIVYDLYTLLGTVKLNVDYEVEEFDENDFEVTKVSISPLNEVKEMVSFDLEDEFSDILQECIKDFAVNRNIMAKETASLLKFEFHIVEKPKLACEKFDFSAN